MLPRKEAVRKGSNEKDLQQCLIHNRKGVVKAQWDRTLQSIYPSTNACMLSNTKKVS